MRAPVAAAICQRQVSESQAASGRAGRPDPREQRLADRHRDLVLLALQSVRAGDPAAVVVHVDRLEARHEREQVERRQPDAVAAKLARPVVGERLAQLPEARVQAPLVVEVEQELADVPRGIGDGAGILVVEVEHLAVLGLEGVGARGRRADDPVPGARVARQDLQVAASSRHAPRRTARC